MNIFASNKIKRLGVAGISLAAALAFTAGEVWAATEWNVSLWGKRRAFTEHIERMAELVAERSNGDFTLKLHYGGALSKNRENLDGISIGAFEMAQFCAGYHRDKNPSITVLELPFLGVSTLEEEIAVSQAVYNHPATKADMARWNAMLLMPSPLPQYNLVGVGDAPTTLADFDGMRVRATGGIGNAFKLIGAVPTSMTASEVYNAMESGVVSSVAFAPHAHMAFRTSDIAKWWTTNLNPGTVNCPVVANIDSFNALPKAHQDILLGAVGESLQHYLDVYGMVYEKWDPLLVTSNIRKITLSDYVISDFRTKAAGPVRDAWLSDMSGRGLPAQELYDLVQDTLK
ncbi:MAG: C4-dicarboxylate TRAP transporter substrate-binding protein [Pseudomonadota bacterium]